MYFILMYMCMLLMCFLDSLEIYGWKTDNSDLAITRKVLLGSQYIYENQK